jgi:hypothetical protein
MSISASGPDHQQPASEHLGQALPPLPAEDYWSPNIFCAHEILQDAYQHAVGLLHQEDSDLLHIQIQADQISHRMVPLLEALHHEVGDINWMTTCAGKFGELLCSLENLVLAASQLLQTHINFPRFLPIFPDFLEQLSHLAPIY